jgi:hypothetical protein
MSLFDELCQLNIKKSLEVFEGSVGVARFELTT